MSDMKHKAEPLRKRRGPVVIGTGLLALDVVLPNGLDSGPQLRAGGTCGNVLTILSFLGWRAYPIARLSNDGASKQVAADLGQWGVHLDFVTFDDSGSTPVIVQRIRSNKPGDPVHSFSRKCPGCGAMLPWYKPVRVADVAVLGPRLPRPQVFFFDRTSPGALALAREAREQGALICFEPSASSDPNHLEEALRIAHIVKISSERVGGNEAVLKSSRPIIVIETFGGAGLRLRYKDPVRKPAAGVWHKLLPIPTDSVKDTAGAGDWCTAGILYMLGALGAKGLDTLTLDEVRGAVQVGQAMASWTCGFEGPRGGMYLTKKEKFHRSVLGLLNGRAELAQQVRSDTGMAIIEFKCESCQSVRSGLKAATGRNSQRHWAVR